MLRLSRSLMIINITVTITTRTLQVPVNGAPTRLWSIMEGIQGSYFGVQPGAGRGVSKPSCSSHE